MIAEKQNSQGLLHETTPRAIRVSSCYLLDRCSCQSFAQKRRICGLVSL